MNYKIQPHSEEAEKALLGSILTGGSEVFEKCKHWVRQSEAFYSDDNKKIWKNYLGKIFKKSCKQKR